MNSTNLLKIKEKLSTYIDDTDGLITIQAGHFSLVHDQDNQLIPLIREQMDDEYLTSKYKALSHLWNFPVKTWELGLELANYALNQGKECKMVLLVNDWQYVQKAKAGANNNYRNDFYQKSKIPDFYRKELQKYGLNESLFLPFKTQNGKINHPFLFSEIKLVSRYKNYYKTSCSLEHGCAQECVPLIHQLHQEGASLFINFIPSTCELPVDEGSKQAYNLLDDGDFTIVNVFCKGVLPNFWGQAKISVID